MANVEAVTATSDGQAAWGVQAAAWRVLGPKLERTDLPQAEAA